jgi:hypothetical protein
MDQKRRSDVREMKMIGKRKKGKEKKKGPPSIWTIDND